MLVPLYLMGSKRLLVIKVPTLTRLKITARACPVDNLPRSMDFKLDEFHVAASLERPTF